MKRLVRWFVMAVMGLAVLLSAGTLVPRPLFDGAAGSVAPSVRLLLLSSSIHTDIAVPVEAVRGGSFAFLRAAGLPVDSPDARWVSFGWGGRAFYTRTPQISDIELGPLLKALTIDDSVMRVQVLGSIDEDHGAVSGFVVSAEGLRRMLAFVRGSLAARTPVPLADAGYDGNDAFFEAIGRFNALVGCNTWTGAALRQAGLQTGWWTPLPQMLVASMVIYN